MSSTTTRIKLGDIWPGPWPPLGTGPGVPNTNHPSAVEGYMAYKRWRNWRDADRSRGGRWYGHEVTLIWASNSLKAASSHPSLDQ